MSSANEHYATAESMLTVTADQAVIWAKQTTGSVEESTALDTVNIALATAQVHATLALAKATMDLRHKS